MGVSAKKGKSKLAVVTYINAGKKVGLPSKLWLSTILFNTNACVTVSSNVISTFDSGVRVMVPKLPRKEVIAGSNNIGWKALGR